MSIKIGGMDLAESIINLEYQLVRTQKILEWVLNNNNNLTKPSLSIMNDIDGAAISQVQQKYPQAGIEKK